MSTSELVLVPPSLKPLRVESSERSLEATAFSSAWMRKAPLCTPRYSRVVPEITSSRVASSSSRALELLALAWRVRALVPPPLYNGMFSSSPIEL
ncbi:hypothetical protein D3C71_1485460 [compost metagenome]